MRIVLIGQAAFGERVVRALIDKGEQLVAIYAPSDVAARRLDQLKNAAKELGIPLFQCQAMSDPEVYGSYCRLEFDLGIMAYVTEVVPKSILNCPRLGTIQYHPSLLPKHRGASAINWAIINGETETGITVFWPDEGIDTGPILLQKEVEIAPDDTVGSLYYDKLFPLGVEGLLEAVDLIRQGVAPRISQHDSQATYEPLCTEKEVVIDWSQPMQRVYNLIRGSNPQPGALAYFRGNRLKIFDCQPRSIPRENQDGEIVEVSDEGFIVATRGGHILVKHVQPEEWPKSPAADYAKSVGLKVGERLRQ